MSLREATVFVAPWQSPERVPCEMDAEVRKFMYGVLPRNYPTCERVLARFTSGIIAYGRQPTQPRPRSDVAVG